MKESHEQLESAYGLGEGSRRLSKRTCYVCGAVYRVPVGTKTKGCQSCAPRPFDEQKPPVGPHAA